MDSNSMARAMLLIGERRTQRASATGPAALLQEPVYGWLGSRLDGQQLRWQ